MSGVHLLGVGATSFSRNARESRPLAREAVSAALADAGLGADAVDGIAIAAGDSTFDSGCFDILGRAGRRYHCHCGLGATALHAGWKAISAGASDVIVCVGHDPPPTARRFPPIESQAAAARIYMRSSGATEEHLARVAAKNRAHGAANPHALLRSTVDPAEVLASDVLAWPLRRLMVATHVQGAAAVVLGSREVGRRHGPRAPRLRTSVLIDHGPRESAAARAARLGYFSAEVGPEDIDVAEIEDPTPVDEIAAYEALELAPDGCGPELVESGFTALGGVVPVNPSGGTLAQGRVNGTGGIRQLVELSLQLRDRAGRRQVPGARVGLGLAGGWTRCGTVTSMTILST